MQKDQFSSGGQTHSILVHRDGRVFWGFPVERLPVSRVLHELLCLVMAHVDGNKGAAEWIHCHPYGGASTHQVCRCGPSN